MVTVPAIIIHFKRNQDSLFKLLICGFVDLYNDDFLYHYQNVLKTSLLKYYFRGQVESTLPWPNAIVDWFSEFGSHSVLTLARGAGTIP